MSEPPPAFDPLAHMEAMAPTCGLLIDPAHKPGVAAFLTLAHSMATALQTAPLPDDTLDPAPVFRPGIFRPGAVRPGEA